MARVVLGANREQTISNLRDGIREITAEIKPFEATDFRAIEVRDRSSEPDEEV
jgi:hypothetical protein